jgi:hypothetical protein
MCTAHVPPGVSDAHRDAGLVLESPDGVTGLPHPWGNGSPANLDHSMQVTRTCNILHAPQPQSPQSQHWQSTHWQVPHLQQPHDGEVLSAEPAAS